jgi:hypothetical protein
MITPPADEVDNGGVDRTEQKNPGVVGEGDATALSGVSEVPTVGVAAELLGTKYHKDYRKYFEAMCKKRDLAATAPLSAYVDAILKDTLAWLESFPENLHSKSAYSKPKTAMLNLLSDASIVEGLGSDYCRAASKAIELAFKAHSNVIVEKRLSGSKRKVLQVLTSGGEDSGGDSDAGFTDAPAGDADAGDAAAAAATKLIAEKEEEIERLRRELDDTVSRLDSLKLLVVKMGELHADDRQLELTVELMKRW